MTEAYSKVGRTVDKYAIFLSSAGQPLRFLLRNPSFWFAAIAVLVMWWSQDRSSEISTPRYFSLATVDRKTPHSSYMKDRYDFPLYMDMMWYFEALKRIPQLDAHSSRFLRSC